MTFDPSKRNFFKRSSKSIAKVLVDELDHQASAKDLDATRPPFAVKGLELALHCTRCNACVEACDTGVIALLECSPGNYFYQTPVIDPAAKACLLCADWPCVIACPTLAISNTENLVYQAKEQKYYPRLATVEIDTHHCLPYLGPECGACRESCPFDGVLQFDTDEKPSIDASHCVGCGQCIHACILEPAAIRIQSQAH